MMKLLGYRRIQGEKDGRKYDFYQLVIDEDKPTSPDSDGVQLIFQRRNGRYTLPSITADAFRDAIKNGVRIGSNVNIFFDMHGNTKLEAVSDFMDIR